jgi:hypothetical protein
MNLDSYNTELLINRSIKELSLYSQVFQERIVPAFNTLDEEAKEIQQEAYAQSAASAGPDADAGCAAEDAYHEGVDFFLATDAVRQGVFNLTVAGLYHLFEQQIGSLLLQLHGPPPNRNDVGDRLSKFLKYLTIDIKQLKGWSDVEELRLVANSVKHGHGSSSRQLRQRNPKLFLLYHDDLSEHFPLHPVIRPLAGEGLYLTPDDFNRYAHALTEFWKSLLIALKPKLST